MNSETESLCASCSTRKFIVCGVLGNALATTDIGLNREFRSLQARQNIYRSGERIDQAFVMCEGWAFSYRILSDGRRQILSFILPGEMISSHMIFRPQLTCSVEMLSPGRICKIDRRQLATYLQANTEAFDCAVNLCIMEAEEGYDMLADLGRRRAEERIARLILRIRNRLASQGLVQDNAFFFPLRQQHIADACGLTPIHVNRVLASFRKSELIEFSRQNMRILDMKDLSRIADCGEEEFCCDGFSAGAYWG